MGVLACSVLGSLLATAWGMPQGGDKAELRQARSTVEFLDSVLRPRFKDEKGRFGVSRFETPNGHSNVTAFGRSPEEKTRLDELQAKGPSFLVYFLRVNHPAGERPEGSASSDFPKGTTAPREGDLVSLTHGGGRYARVRPAIDAQPDAAEIKERRERLEREIAELKPSIQRTIPTLKRGRKVEQETVNWFVTISPIGADDATCLACHRGAKKGETLGALIYLVHRKPADP